MTLENIAPARKELHLPDHFPEILKDKNLAKLGDSYLNFLYSYSLSRSTGTPTGSRISDQTLANVARATGLRQLLPPRSKKGRVADAVESLLAYAWLKNTMSFSKMIDYMLEDAANPEGPLAEMVRSLIRTLNRG